MKRALAGLLLLALAACGGAPPANNGQSAAPPLANDPAPNNSATTSQVPPNEPVPLAPSTFDSPAPPSQGPVGETGQGAGDSARDRFIVCPGNPRCPPEGSQPKGRQPD